ncbi:MAG: inositol 2-dehydrogenase [Symbiobacterium sp.]|uniref:inositol 2-dehydrogenase n=1 Tax=Symbiobacterium sp. TaxID=1971213 RepID=UPI003464D6E3
MSNARLGCAVLGLGRMGYRHANILATQVPEARLVAVSDALAGRTAEVAADFGVRGSTDWREIVADPEVDAVIVATPSTTHAEICIAAAKAGKAIFCEKPLALTVAECEAIGQAVDAAGVPFQLGFMRRFDPGYAAARRAIDEGAIGDVVAYNGISRDPEAPPEAYVAESGGIYLDCLIHEFDIARFLMGDEVTRVYATGKALVYPWFAKYEDVDTAHVILEFARGGIGHIEGSRHAFYGYDIRGEVIGTKGTITIGYQRQTPIMLLTRAGVTHDLVPGFLERFEQSYAIEIVEFVNAVRAGRKPSVGVWDGRQALAVALAAGKSQRLGRPVALEEV